MKHSNIYFGSFAKASVELMQVERDPDIERINATIPKLFEDNRMTEGRPTFTFKGLLKDIINP